MAISNTAEPLPDYLQSTRRLVAAAYPNGIPPRDYEPLMAVLIENMSQRNLGHLIAHLTGRDYGRTMNDVYKICSPYEADNPDESAKERIRALLRPHGYETWVKEDE